MADLKVINVNIGVYDKNNTIAEEIRVRNKMNRTFLANIMASPGAGKTSVLTERVFRLVANGTPIDRMLILTFTRAAASD